MEHEPVGRLLAVVRRQKGLTQKLAAETLGVPMRTYQRWEQLGPSPYGVLLLEKEGW